MKKTLIILVVLATYGFANSQELNCQISVNSNKVTGTNKQIFQKLQQDIYEFMNNRKWTNNVFSMNERIECQIRIDIDNFNGVDKFTSTISVQSTRPIYNTNYKSTLLNYKEKDQSFKFEYAEGQALEFSENTHLSNLTSVLAFYAYIIIGLDYDSYGNMSGTPYFQKAKQIVDNAQSEPDPFWKAFDPEKKNRYYIVDYLLSSSHASLRQFSYKYHRLGLDVMSNNATKGRAEITKSFTLLQKTFRREPQSPIIKILMTTKLSEYVKIYSKAPMPEKKKIYNILKEIEPTSEKVEQILKKDNKNGM